MEAEQPQEEFVHVSVENPIIHNTYEEGRYTTYDVVLQTNSLSFTSKRSVVKRKYSEFQWLQRTLSRTTGGIIPSIPMGRIWFGEFSETYLNKRQVILTEFLRKLVKDTLLVANTALHLFLQTELNQQEMDRLLCIRSRQTGGRSMNCLDNARVAYGTKLPRVPSRTSEADIAARQRSLGVSNRSFATSQSLPVVHGFHEVALNGVEPDTEKEFPSQLFARNRSGSESSSSVGSEVAGSFSATGARTRGNSLRRRIKETEWEDWVIIENQQEPQLTLREQLHDLGDVSDKMRPEDYTNVKWLIGDVSPSSSVSNTSHMSSLSRKNSATSLTVNEKARRHSLQENHPRFSKEPCCSYSSPIQVCSYPQLNESSPLTSTPNTSVSSSLISDIQEEIEEVSFMDSEESFDPEEVKKPASIHKESLRQELNINEEVKIDDTNVRSLVAEEELETKTAKNEPSAEVHLEVTDSSISSTGNTIITSDNKIQNVANGSKDQESKSNEVVPTVKLQEPTDQHSEIASDEFTTDEGSENYESSGCDQSDFQTATESDDEDEELDRESK